MKYYNIVPENFLMIRFVATRFCNYRCPDCYLTIKKRNKQKTMFSHYTKEEWLKALKETFSDKTLEFYFTGGEPLLVKDCILMIKELVKWKNVQGIRIDSNISNIDFFLKHVKSEKVKFLTAFHPTQVSLKKYVKEARKLKKDDMLGIVNFVASKKNLKKINMPPHKLIDIFEQEGMFLNIAKDFMCRTYGYRYDKNYKEYINLFQHSFDTRYMEGIPLNKGYLCGGGKHYIFFNRHGKVYSCGRDEFRKGGLGNIFHKTVRLEKDLCTCEDQRCPCLVSYSFSSSNTFDPTRHIEDYVSRCSEARSLLDEEKINRLWSKVDINHIWKRENIISPIKKLIYLHRRGELWIK